jgi:hypothetical protein
MHGIIFASLHDYARARLGSEATQEIFGGRFFAMSDSHPDDEFVRLLERTAKRLDLDGDDMLRDFGAFTAETTFARLYPAFFTIAGDTRSFLLSVEDRIHELVRATVPKRDTPGASRASSRGAGTRDYLHLSPTPLPPPRRTRRRHRSPPRRGNQHHGGRVHEQGRLGLPLPRHADELAACVRRFARAAPMAGPRSLTPRLLQTDVATGRPEIDTV